MKRKEQQDLFPSSDEDIKIKKKTKKEDPVLTPAERILRTEVSAVTEYDQKPEVDRVTRQQQPTFQLKIFNNWVKSVLI